MNHYLPFIGRVLIGLPFVVSGLGKLATYGPTTAMIAAVGLPVPPLAYLVAVIFELGGGLLLLAGYRVRPVALALAVFCVVAGAAFAIVPRSLEKRLSRLNAPAPKAAT